MNRRYAACFVVLLFMICCVKETPSGIDEEEFIRIAADIAKGWNEGNAALAARHFSNDAVYEEPPKKQFYRGQKSIYEFFGGEKGFDKPMRMKWHNLAFNSAQQCGFGEYTFAMNNQYHGIVVMKFEEGRIVKWREYQYKSDLDWKTFAGESGFGERE
jgi:hypothetical protein